MATITRAPAPQTTTSTGPRVRWLVVLLLAVGIGVYFPLQYLSGSSLETMSRNGGAGLSPTYADRPLLIQVAFYVHIVTAGLSLLIGGFQFSQQLRRRAPRVHRWIGRTYVVSVLVGAVAALVMSFYSSVALLGLFGFGTLAVLWFWTTYRGYTAIRAHDVASHQAWMIRSFALTYAAVTLRLWLLVFIVGQVLLGVSGDLYANAYAPVPFTCWLGNVVVAEWLIRRRNLPGLRFTTPTAPRRAAVANPR